MKREMKQVLAGIGSVVVLTGIGTGLSSVYGQSGSASPSLKPMNIYLDNKLVSAPKGLSAIDPNSHKYTTYMPIWYIMYALKALNIQSTWDGTNWQMSLPAKIKPNFKQTGITGTASGSGKVAVWIDGTLVQKDAAVVVKDPSSNVYTTYVPVWYVGEALNYFGITSTWDGVNWRMTLTNGATSGNGWGGLGGVAGGVSNTVNNTLGGTNITGVLNSVSGLPNSTTGLSKPMGGATTTVGNLVH